MPNPLMRRDPAIPISAMIPAARTGPMPGSASRSSTTRIRAMASSVVPEEISSAMLTSPRLSRSLAAARTARAFAALSKASERSCGVSSFRPTAKPLSDRICDSRHAKLILNLPAGGGLRNEAPANHSARRVSSVSWVAARNAALVGPAARMPRLDVASTVG